MCGIVGVLCDGALTEACLAVALRSLHHRGPDGQGIWISPDGKVALGHSRLSILDLSAASRQPMSTEDGTVWISFNGEIYNFRELRRELERAGHRFRSQGDTEVIVHGYREWGKGVVKRLRGMFAIAIWDVREQQLHLFRDRLGIKPLYYYQDRERFAFASELPALTGIAGLDLSADETALYDYLTYGYIPAPKTPYRAVRKLPPGTTLSFAAGRSIVEQYWDVEFGGAVACDPDAAQEGLDAALKDSVRAHLISDVDVGCLLSGGLDSSTVAAYAQRGLDRKLKTYCVDFDPPEFSEAHYARLVASHLGTDHHETKLALSSAKALTSEVMNLYGEPFGDTSAIPTLAIARFAREDVKVILSGDGGDEIFGGYAWYQRHLRRQQFRRVPEPIRRLVPSFLEASSMLKALRGMPRLIDTLRSDIERHVVIMGGFTKAQKARVLRPEVARRYRDYDDYWYFRKYWRPDYPLLTRLQYLDLKTYLADDILVKVDRATMTVALEARPPLLDHILVEFVAGLPEEVRCKHRTPKHLLKRAAEPLLPREILQRSKKGFSIPAHEWMASLCGPEPARHAFTPGQSWLLADLQRWSRGHEKCRGSALLPGAA